MEETEFQNFLSRNFLALTSSFAKFIWVQITRRESEVKVRLKKGKFMKKTVCKQVQKIQSSENEFIATRHFG